MYSPETERLIAHGMRGNMWHVAKDRSGEAGASSDVHATRVSNFLTSRQRERFRGASLVPVRFATPPPWGRTHERYAQVLFVQEASDPSLPLIPEFIGIDP